MSVRNNQISLLPQEIRKLTNLRVRFIIFVFVLTKLRIYVWNTIYSTHYQGFLAKIIHITYFISCLVHLQLEKFTFDENPLRGIPSSVVKSGKIGLIKYFGTLKDLVPWKVMKLMVVR